MTREQEARAALTAALVEARAALAGDSNDAEHDALYALVDALDDLAALMSSPRPRLSLA